MAVLNWRTDPVYFDPEPFPVNEWLNANELIEAGNKVSIIRDPDLQFNLFPMLVRRVDFVRTKPSDRILARFPFVNITKEEEDRILDKQLLISEKLRDYFYQSDNRSILEWRDVLRKHLERGFVPLPFIRCFSEFVPIFLLVNREFRSARGESFIMPPALTEDLAYLCGIVNGDGSLGKYKLSIVDYSTENIKQLQKQFWGFFAQQGRIQFQSENWPEIIITNLWVIRFFSFLTSQPIGQKKYPSLREPLILLEEPYRSYYWSGVMDADGSYNRRNITLTSASLRFVQDFSQYLSSLKIQSTLIERNDGTNQVYVPRRFHDIYKEHFKCLHPEKRYEFMKLKKGGTKELSKAQVFVKFDETKLVNGFFDFSELKGVQILGLGKFLEDLRDKETLKSFSNKLKISPRFLRQLEQEQSALSITLLEKILGFQKKQLMPFLCLYGRFLQYRKMRAHPIFLNLKPNKKLSIFAKKMIFYHSVIKLPSNDTEFQSQIQKHFAVKVENNLITNKLLRYFFATFGIYKANEDY